MNPLVAARLRNQRAVAPRFATPRDAVHALGAVQAQDFAGSLWGIALRTTNASLAEVEAAITAREIVRTWPMRGTLHFVDARDLRWLVGLLAPRVIKRAASRYRDLGLDDKTLVKSRKLVEKALAGTTIARPDVYKLLAKGGVDPGGQRGIHIIGALAMQRVICFGVHHGKQAAFALVDDWLPKTRELDRDEAMGELATRYFTSHGPATVVDFAWWAGLSLGEAKRALEISTLEVENGVVTPAGSDGSKLACTDLLPPFDELVVAYKDRTAILDTALVAATRGGVFSPAVVDDGKIIGTWRREMKRDRVIVHADLKVKLRGKRALDAAVARYGAFLGRRAELVATGP